MRTALYGLASCLLSNTNHDAELTAHKIHLLKSSRIRIQQYLVGD